MSDLLTLPAPFFVRDQATLYLGHVLDLLAGLPAQTYQTCVTSPPYWALRNYGTAPQVWGGDPAKARLYCTGGHALQVATARVQTGGTGSASAKQVTNRGGQYGNALRRQPHDPGPETGFRNGRDYLGNQQEPARVEHATCLACGCWVGELGSEPTPELFIAHLVLIFRAVFRVLRNDGTLWLNLGDSYSGSGKGPTGHNGIGDQAARQGFVDQRSDVEGLGGKQLLMIPARAAIALQQDGWILRSDIIWEKPDPMPESITDRPTTSHEHVFLFSKRSRYFYDGYAIREPYNAASVGRYKYALQGTAPTARQEGDGSDVSRREREKNVRDPNPAGRNTRTVWTIATEATNRELCTGCETIWSGPALRRLKTRKIGDETCRICAKCGAHDKWLAHFATFPKELVRRCIKAGTSEHGECQQCGAPWERVVEKAEGRGSYHDHQHDATQGQSQHKPNILNGKQLRAQEVAPQMAGWRATCGCEGNRPMPQEVLDPFSGSGTTLDVARAAGRAGTGLELQRYYALLAEDRFQQPMLPLWGGGDAE